MNPFRIALGLFVLMVGSWGGGAAAQSGPGLPKLIYEPDELFTPVVKIGYSTGRPMMHDGYLVLFHAYNGLYFHDVSNPYAPQLVKVRGFTDMPDIHISAQTTAYGGKHVIFARGLSGGDEGGTGFAIWDLTNIFQSPDPDRFDLGVPGGYTSGVFWLSYQAPYVYVGAGSYGLFVVDASDPANPVVANHLHTSQTGGFNTVITLAIGNMLIVTNGAFSGTGMARFDISDPVNPQLLYSSTSTTVPYSLAVKGGNLLAPATGSGGINPVFEARDIFQPNFPVVKQLSLPALPGSVVVQDEFAHVGSSSHYMKVDMSGATFVSVGAAENPAYPVGDWDWVTALGNLVAISDGDNAGTWLIPHDVAPDNTGPSVSMVVPADNAVGQALTSRVGIAMTDMIELESIDATTFFVRPVGGAPLSGSYTNELGILKFTPDAPLLTNTTYEVVVPAGGVRDWSGNATPVTFTSRFSTGGQVTAIDVTAQPGLPVKPGDVATFDVASVTGPGPFQYSWNFGDGTPSTPFVSYSQAMHVYSDAGHYPAIVTVTNGTILGTDSFVQTVHHPLTPQQPTRSSTIALDEGNARVWCVNADNDTITAIDSGTLTKVLEVPVGARPRTLAFAPDGTLWVALQGDAAISIREPFTGTSVDTIALPYASEPFGIAMAPDGSAAFVTLGATGAVAVLDPSTRTWIGTVPVGPDPRGVAVAADSERVFVTRFLSSPPADLKPVPRFLSTAVAGGAGGAAPPPGPGEVHELSASLQSHVRTITLALDEGPDTELSGRGLPNLLSSLSISPDGRRLWVPSKKDNILRGDFRDGRELTFENTVRTIVSQIDLATNSEVAAARIDFNDRDVASAVAFSPLGDYAFTVLQGSNAVDVRDAYSGALVAGITGTGLAPQGLALTSDGATLFVHNFMSRSVSAFDASGVTSSTVFALPLLASVSTVASELLAPSVLAGKQIFYNAADRRMNQDGYISCASCHPDGGHDGQVWDFTDRGEGVRNTISLLGRAGMGHGNVHWTANFDEIQDFENDIRDEFGGAGFMSDADFNSGTVSNPLGDPKAGLSVELDELAAYISSLTQVGLSPYRDADGTLSRSGARGRVLFGTLGCAQCHSGPAFSDSATGVLHDVGTIKAASGQAIGEPLVGFDTPTLRGLWASAPYLHDGSADTLMDVLTTQNPLDLHGVTSTLSLRQRRDLVSYLKQIDDLEGGPP